MFVPIRRATIALAAASLFVSACGGSDAPAAESTAASASVDGAAFNDADVQFAQGMIPHHQQAIEMADLALAAEAAASPQIQALATVIKQGQDPEITLMTDWLTEWGQPIEMDGMDGMDGMDHEGHDMDAMDGMMSAEDMASLAALTGAEFDTAWATMMIAHHSGAITQAQTALDAGANPDVAALAEQIIATQQAEIDQMNSLLAG